MNVITVTREYGAGGAELAQLLAEKLGWELLDRQLLHKAAEIEHIPDADMERIDEKALSLSDHFRLHPPHERYMRGLQAAVNQALDRGNVVMVGRGTRHLVGDPPAAFHLHLMAPQEWRVRRMAERQNWSTSEALTRCQTEERTRQRFMRYFFSETAPQPGDYHLIADTSRVPLAEVAAIVVAVIRNECGAKPAPATGKRVLTLSRELGAGDTSFAPVVGARLGLRVYDRELLEQEALQLGITPAELAKIDEQPPGMMDRLRPGSLHHRYFETLGRLMRDLAQRGDVLVVGRGGSRFLRNDATAFHVRVVAPTAVRVRRVMEHRWIRDDPARQLIADSDSRRRSFYESHFGADWANPLEYHLTVNSGLLGPATVDLIALAAERFWQRTG
jgi:cytidylate kinase